MNKKSVLWILLDLVFLIVFNTIFFVAGGTDHPASVWLSYGFIHFAYIMVLVTPFLTRKSSSSAIFGFALYAVSATYFMVEFVVGLIFILIKPESIKAPLIIQIIIAGVYAVMLIAHLIANESTADSIAKQEAEVSYIKTAASRVKALVGKSADKKINKEIEKVYDALHASPTKSAASVRSLETDIKYAIDELENAVAAQNNDKILTSARNLLNMIDERNRELKLNN